MRDPYATLGVHRDAGQDEIKAAWRQAAKLAHPDSNLGDPTANQRFAEIGRAYDLLKDPKKRAIYDRSFGRKTVDADLDTGEPTIMQQRQAAREAAMRARAAQENAEKIMEELARAAAVKAAEAAKQSQQKQRQQQQQQQQGHVEAEEEPEDVVDRIFGARSAAGGGGGGRAQSTAQPKAKAKPAEAKPAEAEPATRRPDSEQADDAPEGAADAGAATLPILQPLSLLTSLVRRITGAPEKAMDKAPDQLATATVTVEDLMKARRVPVSLSDGREVTLALGPGMTEGHQARLKGLGLKIQGMQRGDVVVHLTVAEDQRFRVHGFDLHTVLPVTIENAVLGMDATVEGPEGPVAVSVPAWSGSDREIRIEGMGLPKEGEGRGDFVVELRIMLWEKPDAKVTDLMRSMKEGLYL